MLMKNVAKAPTPVESKAKYLKKHFEAPKVEKKVAKKKAAKKKKSED